MKRFLLSTIRFYQNYISPSRRPTCRFTPTCSAYMYEAIVRHGVCRGVFLGVRRLLRCHPFGRYGYDPVPDVYPRRRL